MDYWNVSAGNNWGPTSSVLTYPLDDKPLQALVQSLTPSTFRIGGSTVVTK
jgi:hypothetical protein